MQEFFISYNQADHQWAEWIAWQLEEADFAVVQQAWDFRPGSNFISEMHSAAQAAYRTIAVLSPDYLGAPYSEAEWAASLAQDPLSKEAKLLPIKVRECDPCGLLKAIVYIDLVGLPKQEAKMALLSGISRDRAKPNIEPLFPGMPFTANAKSLETQIQECIQILHLSDFQFGSTNDEALHVELLLSLQKTLSLEVVAKMGLDVQSLSVCP